MNCEELREKIKSMSEILPRDSRKLVLDFLEGNMPTLSPVMEKVNEFFRELKDEEKRNQITELSIMLYEYFKSCSVQ